MGGGGNDFTGWTIPTGLDSTANGAYTISNGPSSTTVGITGTGTEIGTDGSAKVSAVATVTATTITVAVSN